MSKQPPSQLHSLVDLPSEILLEIIEYVQDVRDLLDISLSCKTLQKLIRMLVLTIGDSALQSNLFKSISSTYIQLDLSEQNSHNKAIFKNYKHFIFEYSLTHKIHVCKYIELISKYKTSKRHRITEVFLNAKAAHYSFGLHSVNKISQDRDHSFYDIDRTIYANGSDSGLLIEHGYAFGKEKVYDSLTVVGHKYNFPTLEVLPWFLVVINMEIPLRVYGVNIKKISGILHFDDSNVPFPQQRTSNFFNESSFSNVEEISDCTIKSHIDFKLFEQYSKLRVLKLNCYFSLECQSNSIIRLSKLEHFELSGDFIRLVNLDLPCLKSLKVNIQGSSDPKKQPDFITELVKAPKLVDLSLNITETCCKSIHEILAGFQTENLKKLEIDCTKLTKKELKLHKFVILEDLTLKGCAKNYEIMTKEHLFASPNGKEAEVQNLTKLHLLDVTDSYIEMIGNTYIYVAMKELTISIIPSINKYEFNQDKFPVLELLTIDASFYLELYQENKKDHENNDLNWIVNDIVLNSPSLKRVVVPKRFMEHCVLWGAKDGGIEIEEV